MQVEIIDKLRYNDGAHDESVFPILGRFDDVAREGALVMLMRAVVVEDVGASQRGNGIVEVPRVRTAAAGANDKILAAGIAPGPSGPERVQFTALVERLEIAVVDEQRKATLARQHRPPPCFP